LSESRWFRVVHRLLCGGCMGEVDLLRSRVSVLESELGEAKARCGLLELRLDECSAERSLLSAELDEARRSLEYSEWARRRAVEAVSGFVKPPDYSPWAGAGVTYDPWGDEDQPHALCSISDNRYVVFSEDAWGRILDRLYESIDASTPPYSSETWDCDDESWMAYTVHRLACVRAGFKYSGCLGYARSRGHAYNAYRCSDGRWLLWEPQTGETVGRLGDHLGDRYNTYKVMI